MNTFQVAMVGFFSAQTYAESSLMAQIIFAIKNYEGVNLADFLDFVAEISADFDISAIVEAEAFTSLKFAIVLLAEFVEAGAAVEDLAVFKLAFEEKGLNWAFTYEGKSLRVRLISNYMVFEFCNFFIVNRWALNFLWLKSK